jgi:hypothetical protein
MNDAIDIAHLFFEKIREIVASELRGDDPSWVDQANSSLTPRVHIAAVKRRLAEASAQGVSPRFLGAKVQGRRFLLSQESMAAELGALEAKGRTKAKARKASLELAKAEAEADNDAYRRALAAMKAVSKDPQ